MRGISHGLYHHWQRENGIDDKCLPWRMGVDIEGKSSNFQRVNQFHCLVWDHVLFWNHVEPKSWILEPWWLNKQSIPGNIGDLFVNESGTWPWKTMYIYIYICGICLLQCQNQRVIEFFFWYLAAIHGHGDNDQCIMNASWMPPEWLIIIDCPHWAHVRWVKDWWLGHSQIPTLADSCVHACCVKGCANMHINACVAMSEKPYESYAGAIQDHHGQL